MPNKSFDPKRLLVLITLFSTLTLIIFFFLILNTKTQTEDTIQQQFGEVQQNLAEAAAQILEHKVASVHEELALIALSEEVVSGSPEECSTALKNYQKLGTSIINNLSRTGENMVFDCSSLDVAIGVDGNEYSYIKDLFKNPQHETVVSRATPFENNGNTRYLVAIHVPVFEDGEFVGTLGGAIWLDDMFKTLAELDLGEGAYLVVSDDDGTILSHPNPEFVGQNTNNEELRNEAAGSPKLLQLWDDNLEGLTKIYNYTFREEEKVGAITPANILDGRHWAITVVAPVDSIQGPLDLVLRRSHYLLLLGSALLVLTVLIPFTLIVEWNKDLKTSVEASIRETIEQNSLLTKAKTELEKTQEKLKKNLEDSEKLNRLMTGREIKMRELKEELKKLREKI